MRAIDGDALKERYENHRKLYCKNRIEFKLLSEKDKARVDELDNCIADILNAPTIEPEQRWIPCSGRLPDTNRDVLLQFSNSMGVGFWEHNSWGINTGDNIYSEIGEREAQPIAWRELPEPYGGEQDD